MAEVDVEEIRLRLEEAQARRLQPHYVKAFFLEAFARLGGRITRREQRRYQVSHVPCLVRDVRSLPSDPSALPGKEPLAQHNKLCHWPLR